MNPPPWQPRASLAALRARATLLARIRAFFAARAVLEVETPLLSRAAGTDPAIEPLRVGARGPDADAPPLFLHSSPEFPMKRLLAAGSGAIYQICKVFRDGERGARHHPEFTLLEWYRPGWTLAQLMDEVAALARAALDRPTLAVESLAYRTLFRQRLGIDPWATDGSRLRALAVERGIGGAADLDLDPDGWLDLLLSHCLEADLGRHGLTFVHGYPPSQAALARVAPGPPASAERFELYLEGMELANGFRELTDPLEQRRRFHADLDTRARRGLDPLPPDDALLRALTAGLPDSSGVALGLDRLLMIALGARHIDEVLAFPIERA